MLEAGGALLVRADQVGRQRRRDVRLAVGHRPYSPADVLCLRILGQVTGRTGGEGVDHVAGGACRGHHDDLRPTLTDVRDPFRPSDPRQVQVEQDDVDGHVQPVKALDRGGAGNEGKVIGLLDGIRQALADDHR